MVKGHHIENLHLKNLVSIPIIHLLYLLALFTFLRRVQGLLFELQMNFCIMAEYLEANIYH